MRGCVCPCARDSGGTTISARGFPRQRGQSGWALLLCAGPNVSRQGHSCPQPLVSLGQWVCVWWTVELACLDQILLSSSTFSASLPPSELLPSSSSPLRTCQVSCYMTINPCGWITISHKFTFKLHENVTRHRSRVEGHSLASPPPPHTKHTHGIVTQSHPPCIQQPPLRCSPALSSHFHRRHHCWNGLRDSVHLSHDSPGLLLLRKKQIDP